MDARFGEARLTMRRVALLSAASLAFALAGCAASEPAAPRLAAGPDGCAGVTAAAFGASAASTKWVAADSAAGLPAYCEVTGVLSPVPASQIAVTFRLPENWNGKLLGIGGSGWTGNPSLQQASEGLKKGYATAQSDGGHPSTSVWDNSFAADPEARSDFAWRAMHETTVAGKKAVAAYYGRKHERAYYQGCSTGGRMGLMEAQRFPDDYDAIIAGAPVYTLQTQTSGVMRTNAFARAGAGFSPADIELLNKAAVAQCDANDGFADGIVNDPRRCAFDPAQLQCSGEKAAGCLSPQQVTAMRLVYDGIRAPDGSWAMYPMSRAGETAWGFFVPVAGEAPSAANTGGLLTLEPWVFGEAKPEWASFTPSDAMRARASAFAKEYEAADPDLRPFFRSGGRLLLWHGESDPGPSPVGANDYAEAVRRAAPQADSRMRHFLLPGTGHCGAGNGAFQVDWLEAMDRWVTTGDAPEALVGRRPGEPLVRKHCAYPKVARYAGSGDANDPDSWNCVSPA